MSRQENSVKKIILLRLLEIGMMGVGGLAQHLIIIIREIVRKKTYSQLRGSKQLGKPTKVSP